MREKTLALLLLALGLLLGAAFLGALWEEEAAVVDFTRKNLPPCQPMTGDFAVRVPAQPP